MDAGPRLRHQVIGCFATILTVAVCAAQAQMPATPGSDSGGETPPRREVVIESDHEIFYFRTEKGKLVPVPGITLEELQQLRLLKERWIPRNPAPELYTFQGDVRFTGNAGDVEAEFKVDLNIRLRESEDAAARPLVRVPLRLNQAKLLPGAKHDGPGEFFVSYEKQGEGYVAWLRAAPNTDHKITFNIKLPVVRVAGKLRVSMLTPPRPTQLQLDVSGSDLAVTTNNLEENILTTSKVGTGKTRISVENVGGPLEFTWCEKNRSAPVLESSGTTRVTINGQQVDYETDLRVRSYGAPIRVFDVRLPPNAKLIPEPTPGVTVEVVRGAGPKGRLVRVTRQDGKEEPTLDVRLRAISVSPDKVLAGQMELSGFEVVDAVRQTGSLDLAVVGDWSVDWFPGSYVRQVSLGESQRQAGMVARFEYDRQPFSLKVEVREREMRIRVEPTYSLYVEATQLRLVGNLKYTASGARTREVQIQAPRWSIDRVLPTDLIADTILLSKTTPLSIPLAANGTSIAEEFEIRIEAHQPIPADEKSFRVELPRTVGGAAAPATVIVYPADNIELTVRGEEIAGLVSESVPPGFDLSQAQQPPLFYTEELTDEASVFAGEFEVRSRVVAANVDNALRFTASNLAIEQRFDLEISYEPLREVKFDVPEALTRDDQVQFFELIPEAVAAANGGLRDRPLSVIAMMASEQSGIAQVTIELPDERIKPCSIAARYTLPISAAETDDPSSLKLIQISADPSTNMGTSKLRLVATEEVDVELVSDGWDTLIDDLLDPSSREQLFQTSGDVAAVDVVVRLVESPQVGATILEKLWLQSYLSRSLRQDRACYQLRTNAERVQVQLPAGATLLDVAVDRQRRTVKPSASGVLAIDLEPAASTRTVTVEVWYWFAAKDIPVARLSVLPPELAGVPHARRIYWQLVLPRDEHLLVPPSSLTPEYVWRWNSNHWGRRSNRRQADLEAMLNASPQESPPDRVVNQYLFTSVGPILPVQFITASRGSLTLVVSLAVLTAGLCLVYFSWARHPASFLIAGVVVLSLGFAFPEPTILGAQAAALGLLFVLLARLLYWNARRRQVSPLPSGGSSVSRADSDNEFAMPMIAEGNSHTTTTLAPTTYHAPMVEPKS